MSATASTTGTDAPTCLKRHAAKQAVDDSPGEELDAPAPSACATDQLKRLVPAAADVAAACKRLRAQTALVQLQKYLQKLRSWVWHLVEELLEEFQPWLKWIIFDALLTLLVGRLVRHATFLRPLFEAVGWA